MYWLVSEQVQDDLIQDFTPYQATLSALVFPWRWHVVFNILGGVGLALIGAPWLALIWAAGMCVADGVAQRAYRRWVPTAAETDSAEGLKRLGWAVLARTALWFAAPLAYATVSHSPASLAFIAVTAISTTALGVSLGWTSTRIFSAMIVPAALSVTVATVAVLGLGPAAGVLVGLGCLAVTLSFVAIGTHKSISQWSRANRRTIEVMAEMKLALERSEAAERRLRIAIEIADLHVYELDYAHGVLTSLGAEQEFFEQPLTFERMSKDPYHCVAPEHLEATKAAWAQSRDGKIPYRAEYRIRRSDGREVWASASAELTRDETGAPLSLVGALHNITERKRSENELTEALSRAEAGSRAKSEFLTTMSHEIRTPLNGVLGMAQAMERDRLTARQRKRVEIIRKSGQSLLVLLNSVLDLSKIEAGKLELEAGDVDLAGLAQVALDMFDGDAAEKGIAFALHVAPEAEGVYAGDALRVGQVLYNLISNAVKFTGQGAITVAISRPDEVLQIAVSDTGIGISAQQVHGLFEKFSQADASVTRRFGGSGLGLAICQQLAAMMGGTIAVESEEGHGSTFTVRLPLPRLRAAVAAQEPAAAPAPMADADAAPLRVLAAEDNAVNQLVLQTLLQQVGVDPVLVSDGAQALASWRDGEWDLILMDIQMPVMDGVTATRAIRGEEAASGRPRTPIVALTANVMDDQVRAYRTAGMDDVVAKPIEARRLIEAIEAALASASAPAASSAAA